MPELPVGTITFLFTDIEGSTPLWEKAPEVMSSAITLHHTILREVIEANGGVVFKVIGDAFQAAFQLASQGLTTAIEIQRRLATAEWPEACGPLKVRIGLHVGPAVMDDRGDYVASHTLNRVGRVMSAGHGGQILLSLEAKDLMERSLPSGVRVKDMGEHHLKGLSISEHLYQVVANGLTADFPPLITSIQHLPASLLTTKLYIPSLRQEIVSRPRLIEQLNAGLVRKLTLISAPAGFGKTTLLSEWISALGLRNVEQGRTGVKLRDRKPQRTTHPRVAWLSLDEKDNDEGGFWTYIVAALRMIVPELGATTLALLESPPVALPFTLPSIQRRLDKEDRSESTAARVSESNRIEAALTALINEIAALQDKDDDHPLILVLDDYHTIEKEAIHEGLAFFIDHLPPPSKGLHLVIASRTDPPLPLSRWRGRGQLNELNMSDLRFTPDEASIFLNQTMRLGLSAQDVTDLETRTEGWIVGLQMAALAILGRSEAIIDQVGVTATDYQSLSTTEFIQSFTGSDRYIMDYLTDEVLLQQPVDVQNFLLRTSILDRFSSPLCDAVCVEESSVSAPADRVGRTAQDMLERLDKANLFIVPLDNKRKWFRYHHLFAELLRQRLNRSNPDLPSILHQRAAEWYAREGLIDLAISHLLEAGDYERAANLIQQHFGDFSARGEFRLLLSWLDALPVELVRSRPMLCIAYAYSAEDYHREKADRLMESVLAWLATRAQDPKELNVDPEYEIVTRHLAVLSVAGANARLEPPAKVIELGKSVLEIVPESDPALRGIVMVLLSIAYLNSGDEESSERTLIDSIQLSERADWPYLTLIATYVLMMLARRRGRLHAIAAMCRKSLASIIEPIERSGHRMPAGGFIYLALGSVLAEWNDLSGAERTLTKGLEAFKLLPLDLPLVARGVADLARLRIASGDLERLPDLADLVAKIDGWAKILADMVRARIWLIRSQREPQYLQSALLWARERRLEPEDWDWSIWEQLTRARVLIAQSRADSAARTKPDLKPVLDFLDAQLRIVESHGWVEFIIDTLIVQALSFQAQGSEDEALRALERALTLAEPEGYTRIFLDEGVPMERLLYRATQRGILPEYAGKLLAAFETAPASQVQEPLPAIHPPSVLEPLTPREVEVLQLLAKGLSNREIAQRLYISLSTVKRHNATIYGKLAVANRTQAVARGRDLGLL